MFQQRLKTKIFKMKKEKKISLIYLTISQNIRRMNHTTQNIQKSMKMTKTLPYHKINQILIYKKKINNKKKN